MPGEWDLEKEEGRDRKSAWEEALWGRKREALGKDHWTW